MPGDVVLEKLGVVVFIPPHLAEKVVKTSEIVRLRDMFGHRRLREGKYTAGQIDARWSDEIEKDFSKWLNDHIDELPAPKAQIQELLKGRTCRLFCQSIAARFHLVLMLPNQFHFVSSKEKFSCVII